MTIAKLLRVSSVFFAFCLLGATSARSTAAQNHVWLPTSKHRNGSVVYYDPKSVKRTAPNRVRVWIKFVFDDASYQLSLVELHCGDEQFSLLDATAYTETGVFLRKDKTAKRAAVVPDSVIEDFYNRFCTANAATDDAPPARAGAAAVRRRAAAAASPEMFAEIIVERADIRVLPKADAPVVRRARRNQRFVLLVDEPDENGWYPVEVAESLKSVWLHGGDFKIVAASENNKPAKRTAKPPRATRKNKN